MIDNKKWLKVKADAYNKYQKLPDLWEPIRMSIVPAYHGWIDILFSVSQSEYKVYLSSFPEPFLYIKEWLEDLVMRTDDLDSTKVVNCDYKWEIVFHFEHLTSFKQSVGIFYLYDSDEDHCLSGYIRLYDLVNVIYNGILNYALEGEKTEEFRENWIRYVDERDYPDGLLSSVFRSEIIEKYLELDNRYDTRWAFTKN
jgi:hypothetical protein